VYLRLAGRQEVEGIDPVDATSVLAALREAFAIWSVQANLWTFQPDRDGNGPGFDLEVYPCMVTFSCYGLEAEQINEIIGVMVGLRFPLFDPQTSERFGL
jgi:hypothetical protein